MAADAGETGSPQYEPYAITISPVDGTLWVSNLGASARAISVVDPRTRMPVRNVRLGSVPQFGLWRGNTFLVPAWSPDVVAAVDGETFMVTATVPMQTSECTLPHALAASATGRLFLVCEGDKMSPGSLVELDAQSRASLGAVTLGVFPNGLTFLGVPR